MKEELHVARAPDTVTFRMPGETEGAAITISGGQAFANTTTRTYADGTIVDSATGVTYYEQTATSPRKTAAPDAGFKTSVGFDNYRRCSPEGVPGRFPRLA